MQMSCLKGPFERGGYGENSRFGKNGEILSKSLMKVEDFMQKNRLKELIESGGYGKNGRFGKNDETGEISPMSLEDGSGRWPAY